MIFAFDRDLSRFKLLQDRVKQAGASNILPEYQDFLELDVCSDKYKNVRSILCDPSCSGSGVIRSVERIIEKKNIDSENSRVAGLHAFQVKVVNKAMSFPNVEIIVYSTCSIHKVLKINAAKKLNDSYLNNCLCVFCVFLLIFLGRK
jgi:putative methyltransferase